MQRTERQASMERLSPVRKGHMPQISISDDRHHVTEAIGSYYDDDNDDASTGMASPVQDMRPLSFVPSQRDSISHGSDVRNKRHGSYFDNNPNHRTSPPRTPMPVMPSHDRQPPSPGDDEHTSINASPKSLSRVASLGADNKNGNVNGQPSPPPMSRQTSAEMAFPLNDIDYESSPAAVAQELYNLQAIRRMSMNVDAADPDLPSFGGAFSNIPSVAPKHSDDNNEDDPSKLFWVPARLHPELAPKEFKTFIEDRVDKIRRRSGGEDSLSPDSLERSGSDGSLRRKKSMLSQQIDTKGNYQDGAERLERKRSKGVQLEGQAQVGNLAELEQLVNDPAQLVRRMSLDTTRRSLDSGIEVPPTDDDMPILPPVGTLKRSTRTTYRRGSLKKGERVPFSRRAQQRQSETDTEETPVTSPVKTSFEEPILGLTRTQTEPPPQASRPPEVRRDPSIRRKNVPEKVETHDRPSLDQDARETTSPPRKQSSQEQRHEEMREERYEKRPSEEYSRQQPRPFQSRFASQGRTTAQLPGYNNTNPLPQIIETLPDGTKVPVQSLLQSLPERKSSHDVPRQYQRPSAQMRSIPGRHPSHNTTLDDISSRPSPLPGSGGTSTDALTMVPTFDDRKFEKKEGPRKSTWKWILGNDNDDEKKSRDDRLDSSSKSKSKVGKISQDKARLDVLQNSIDGTTPIRGRESLVLNREDIRIEDDRKAGKKSSDGSRKERDKEPGLLSAIFGGKKKSSDHEARERRRKPDRNLSPEPPPRILKPDIDYNWTRFSILEERAIYRMAHIKLANPRRALYSQVLLSNFMYSYLAKVQMMHPQMQIPAAHKAAQQRGQKSDEQQPPEFSQYQRWQEQQARQDAAANAQTDAAAQQSSFDTSSDSSGGHRSSFDTVGDQAYSGYDRRRSEDFGRNAYTGQSGASHTNGGSGYNVASTNDYLGYGRGEQPFGQPGLWDDEEKEDLW